MFWVIQILKIDSGVGFTTLQMYLMLCNSTSKKMVKMVNMMLYIFYHNKKKMPGQCGSVVGHRLMNQEVTN